MKKIIISILVISCIVFVTNITPALAITVKQGPTLMDMSENAVTIVWYSDVAAEGKVEYGTGGAFTNTEYEVNDAFEYVGWRHTIRLTGLTPGTTYNYRLITREVTSLQAYSPTFGSTITSSSYSFTTFNSAKTSTTFYYITDPQNNDVTELNKLLNLVPWAQSDFMAFGGDMLESVEGETQVFNSIVNPLTTKFAKTTPMVYTRGNHEMRGHFARILYDYFPNSTGQWYYGFNHGPASFAVVDSGEDKADSSVVFSGLTASQPYVASEYTWYNNYINSSLYQSKPAKIVFTHMQGFPYYNDSTLYNPTWINATNNAGVKLVIAGHDHSYLHYTPGHEGADYHTVIVGQKQVAKFVVTATQISVTIYNDTNGVVDSFNITL